MEPNAVEIREFQPPDLAVVAELCVELGYAVTSGELGPRIASMQPGQRVLVAAERPSGRVVGWMEIQISHHIHSGSCLEISGLVVARANQSQGIGRLLVAAAEDIALREGLRRIRVRSNITRERAHGFYQQLGYTAVKTSRVFEKTLAKNS